MSRMWKRTAVGCLLLAAATAGRAVEIWNGTNLLFDARGFEFVSSVTTNSYESQLAAGVGTDDDPDNALPAGASYSVTESTNYSIQAVAAPFSATDPGPAEGAHYLRIKRGGSGSQAWLVVNYPAMQTNGLVRVECMLFPSNTANHCFNFQMKSGSTLRLGLLGNLNGRVQYITGGVWYDSGLTYVSNRWQTLTVDYEPGATTFSFSIAGVATSDVPVSAAGSVNNFNFSAAANYAKFYLDRIPAPRRGALITIR